ncbi:hypothetical protein K9M42_03190 [Patescibacteria group bacterium]|nr:hypothetical protein [Patescibacteria group bacterium]
MKIKSLKNNIDIVGINLFCYDYKNEIISEIFIKEALSNYHIIKSYDTNKIIEILKKEKDKKFVIYYTIQEMLSTLRSSNTKQSINNTYHNLSFQYSKFLRKLYQICINNNLSLILKSSRNFRNCIPINIIYQSKLIISFNGDNIEIHKSRYLVEGVVFSLKNQLKKYYRKEKLKNLKI